MCRRLCRQATECWQLQDLCETCKDYLLKGKLLAKMWVFDELISYILCKNAKSDLTNKLFAYRNSNITGQISLFWDLVNLQLK